VFLPLCDDTSKSPDMCISQVHSVRLAPHVFNPLSRVYVRPDIYHMAQQANILNVPGAEVEDRQYQLDVCKLSVHTGSWADVERLFQSKSKGGELNPLSENPAVEWNKLALGKDTLGHDISVLSLVHNLDVSLMVAPAIIYQQAGHADILVCGHSAELNATSDIEISISTDQLALVSSLLSEWLQLSSTVYSPDVTSCPSPLATLQDSGIDDQSSVCSPPIRRISKCNQPDFIPTEILITASKIVFTLYNLQHQFGNSRRCKKTHKKRDEDENFPPDLGYEASEDSSVENMSQSQLVVQPLFYAVFLQPHCVFACHSLKQRVEISCFDSSLRTSHDSFTIRSTSTKLIPKVDCFNLCILETRGGDPHPKTGIPPSLLTATWSNFLSKAGGELNVELGRPLHVHMDPGVWHSLQQLEELLIKLLQPLRSSPSQSQPKLLSRLWDIPCMVVKTCQILLTASHDADREQIALSVDSISGSVASKTSIWSEKGTLKAQLQVNSLMLKLTHEGRQRIFMHPCSLTSDTIFSWESWLSNANSPLVETAFNCDSILIDIGPDQVKFLLNLWNSLEPYLDKYKNNKSIPQVMPSATQDEHYRDDLRAGAFQFIEMEMHQDLPLPYQVLFCQRPLSMAWRYPQPRALTRVDVFPVPFISASLPMGDDQQVECLLQLWNECQNKYITYCPFNLSESQMCRLTLPSVADKQHVMASSCWRVLLYPHTKEEYHTPISISSRALAACMRVDSFFSPSLVPQLQASANVAAVRVNFICQTTNLLYKLPKTLANFTNDGAMPECLPMASVELSTSNLQISQWSCGTILNAFETSLACDTIDMATLTKINLIESFRVTGQVFVCQYVKNPKIDINILTRNIHLKFGTTATHTLITAVQLWQRAMDKVNHTLDIIPSRYIVCNDSEKTIRIRQCDTKEDILVHSRHCHMYAWRSSSKKQCLQVTLADSGNEWSQPLLVDDECTKVIYFTNGEKRLGLLWRIVSLSSTQKMILLSGQLIISNDLQETLECQVLTSKKPDGETLSWTSSEIITAAGQSIPASLFLQSNRNVVLKVRFQSLSAAWSGDIPLESNSTSLPWLVKVPLQEKGQFLSIWCRIFSEQVEGGNKILAALSPLYSIRSLLPNATHLSIFTPGLQVVMPAVADGCGTTQQLYCPGTVEHSHKVRIIY
jgi:vacuolar protein sorting-associated protein 13B